MGSLRAEIAREEIRRDGVNMPSMGVNIKMVQEILGHSDIIVTLGIYGHLLPAMHEEAMSKWDEKLKPDSQSDKGAK